MPHSAGTTFDHDYWIDRHMAIVKEHFGEHIKETLVTRGAAGGPNFYNGKPMMLIGEVVG